MSSSDFKWENFLDVANNLREAGDQASLRSAVSRAYYAAFHAARKKVSGVPKPGGAHETVWRALNRTNKKVGLKGDRLRQQRAWADYSLDQRNAKEEAERAIMSAQFILENL